jgi:hypothetical protein
LGTACTIAGNELIGYTGAVMIVSVSPDSSSCGTWAKEYLSLVTRKEFVTGRRLDERLLMGRIPGEAADPL